MVSRVLVRAAAGGRLLVVGWSWLSGAYAKDNSPAAKPAEQSQSKPAEPKNDVPPNPMPAQRPADQAPPLAQQVDQAPPLALKQDVLSAEEYFSIAGWRGARRAAGGSFFWSVKLSKPTDLIADFARL
jgi:hypothetical protein